MLESRVLMLEVMMRDLIEGLKHMPPIPFGENFRKIGADIEEDWGK
jgi:hypothetical protein